MEDPLGLALRKLLEATEPDIAESIFSYEGAKLVAIASGFRDRLEIKVPEGKGPELVAHIKTWLKNDIAFMDVTAHEETWETRPQVVYDLVTWWA